jgi:hypothetical protein
MSHVGRFIESYDLSFFGIPAGASNSENADLGGLLIICHLRMEENQRMDTPILGITRVFGIAFDLHQITLWLEIYPLLLYLRRVYCYCNRRVGNNCYCGSE